MVLFKLFLFAGLACALLLCLASHHALPQTEALSPAALGATAARTFALSPAPTAAPTVAPTAAPTVAPTAAPTVAPTIGNHEEDLEVLRAAVETSLAVLREIRARAFTPGCHAPDCWWQASAGAAISAVQEACRAYALSRYGPEPYLAQMDVSFPESMGGGDASLVFELAPLELVPYSVYFFLEKVLASNQGGKFSRNAPHVLQASLHGAGETLLFQEYDARWPHKARTLGYAGRPGGSGAVYISTIDNTRNHGPDRKGESDVGFGRLLEASTVVVEKMTRQPGAQKMGFITDAAHHIKITAIRCLAPAERDAVLRDGQSR
ncbi:hypothetical protein M885DRAFT_228962 [Pelagophyceae sp. CCMP2097]|nr:hypothetical protein M885DRAFT_228962 [Pelagophyceae sp. CCMP2097]